MRNNKISGTRCGCDLPDDICSEEMERCVLCWRLTDVPKTRPVSQRIGYIEGVGQLCESCYCTLSHRGSFHVTHRSFVTSARGSSYTMPWAIMALATFSKPAMLAPMT